MENHANFNTHEVYISPQNLRILKIPAPVVCHAKKKEEVKKEVKKKSLRTKTWFAQIIFVPNLALAML